MNGPMPHDGGCYDSWCSGYRRGLALRADTAEKAVRAHEHTIRALRGEIGRLKTPPEEPTPEEKYTEFKLKAWILFAVILIVAGSAVLGAVYLAEHLITNTTFNDVRTPG
ncbi:MAG: hypothetical protein ACRD0P_38670 [Stackebrandtia sp.]